MSRFGIIFTAWDSQAYLKDSLTPWIEARKARLGGHDWVICAVNVPFVGFNQSTVLDETRWILEATREERDIDHLITSDVPLTEIEARGRALRWLIDQGCTHSWMVDADEEYTRADILGAAQFVEANPFSVWFRMSLRNAVFTKDQYLVEPFTPPRIHRLSLSDYKAVSFWDDNNLMYNGKVLRWMKKDTEFSSMTIPPSVAFPRHWSWLSDLRSKRKIAYQYARGWPHCSYRWDEKTDSLQFNEQYYAAQGLPLPEVARD